MPLSQAKQITYVIDGIVVDSFGTPIDGLSGGPGNGAVPITVFDEGVSLGQITGLNFVGGGVTVSGSGNIQVSVPLYQPPLLASQAQAEAGLENLAYLSSLRVAQAIDAQAQNLILASQAEAEAGVENTKYMTPLRVAQAIAALGGGIISGNTYADNYVDAGYVN